MKERKLVFNQTVKQREIKRVRKFKSTTIVIGLILCILIIPLLELKIYENDINISQKYISIAKHIWYNGVKDIEYDQLSIKVLHTDIEYESIYTGGICSVSDKVQVILYIDNIKITQDLNTITIHKVGGRKIVTLKFITNANKEVIKTNKIAYWLFEIFFIILYTFLAYMSITLYKSAEYKRMVIDISKNNII